MLKNYFEQLMKLKPIKCISQRSNLHRTTIQVHRPYDWLIDLEKSGFYEYCELVLNWWVMILDQLIIHK